MLPWYQLLVAQPSTGKLPGWQIQQGHASGIGSSNMADPKSRKMTPLTCVRPKSLAASDLLGKQGGYWWSPMIEWCL
jgi:hypothetical protein